MKFALSYTGAHYNAIVNIYAGDGSISIAHDGVESGQGINTKVNYITYRNFSEYFYSQFYTNKEVSEIILIPIIHFCKYRNI